MTQGAVLLPCYGAWVSGEPARVRGTCSHPRCSPPCVCTPNWRPPCVPPPAPHSPLLQLRWVLHQITEAGAGRPVTPRRQLLSQRATEIRSGRGGGWRNLKVSNCRVTGSAPSPPPQPVTCREPPETRRETSGGRGRQEVGNGERSRVWVRRYTTASRVSHFAVVWPWRVPQPLSIWVSCKVEILVILVSSSQGY